MDFFRYFTPISYWVLTVLWGVIFIFYLRRIFVKRLESRLFFTLLVILAIDAFRSLFESIYFGAWYTSLVGFIPIWVHDFLVLPQNVFIPKFLNVIAAALIILIVLKRWLPEEEVERKKQVDYLRKLEDEISERKKVEKEKEALISKLQTTLSELKTLRGILPICSFCKKIRDDEGYWEQVEVNIKQRSDADFSHGVCPECTKKHYSQFIEPK
jgi:hypothetical protein